MFVSLLVLSPVLLGTASTQDNGIDEFKMAWVEAKRNVNALPLAVVQSLLYPCDILRHHLRDTSQDAIIKRPENCSWLVCS